MRIPRVALWAGLFSLMAACAPHWDWRRMVLSDAELEWTPPCRPRVETVQDRGLAVCSEHGVLFSLAWQRLETPQQMKLALQAGPQQLAQRLGMGLRGRQVGLALPAGSLEWPESGAWHLQAPGREALLLTWARGRTVYQALWLAPTADVPVAQAFFSGFRPAQSGAIR